MKNIIEKSGMTLKNFAEYYDIPYQTVRQWYKGERKAPEWQIKLFEKIQKYETKGIQISIDNLKKI